MKTLISLLVILGLAGCASDYTKYGDMQIAVQTAKYNAEAEKYKAISAIAQSGDITAKVAAMFALQNNTNQLPNTTNQLAAPKSVADNIREWVALIMPTLVQGYGIHANQSIAVTQSNNSRDVAVSTNSAFLGMASQIQAPAANVSTTLSGAGVLGSGTYSTSTISDSYNPSYPIDNSNQGNPILTCTTGPC